MASLKPMYVIAHYMYGLYVSLVVIRLFILNDELGGGGVSESVRERECPLPLSELFLLIRLTRTETHAHYIE